MTSLGVIMVNGICRFFAILEQATLDALQQITTNLRLINNPLYLAVSLNQLESGYQRLLKAGIQRPRKAYYTSMIEGIWIGQMVGMGAAEALDNYVSMIEFNSMMRLDALGLSAQRFREMYEAQYPDLSARLDPEMIRRYLLMAVVHEAYAGRGS